MANGPLKVALGPLLGMACLLWSADAEALRCGNKIVRDGMHEVQVIAICGEPTTRRDIGRTLRGREIYAIPRGGGYPVDRYVNPGVPTEVVVTEYIYNFGPRKLMRRLIFEGGVLINIESIGYGYIEKK